MKTPFEIHEETPRDVSAVRVVERAAFGREDEVRLVDRIRSEGLVACSLIAVSGGLVVGHALFTKLTIETVQGDLSAAALAPVAVLPEYQRQGIGSALIRTGLEQCRAQGHRAVLVLGDPKYYDRFGFSSTRTRKLVSPYSHLGSSWMALELIAGALRGPGFVRYPDAFPR